MTHDNENVEPGQAGYAPPVSARDHVSQKQKPTEQFHYTREQKGHSLILNLLLVGPLTLYITTIYWTFSPRHFWHA